MSDSHARARATDETQFADAIAWLECHDPGDGLGVIGPTDETTLCTRPIVLEAFNAGRQSAPVVGLGRVGVELLIEAAGLFRRYEAHHRERIGNAHADDRMRKVRTNAEIAERIETFLSSRDERIAGDLPTQAEIETMASELEDQASVPERGWPLLDDAADTLRLLGEVAYARLAGWVRLPVELMRETVEELRGAASSYAAEPDPNGDGYRSCSRLARMIEGALSGSGTCLVCGCTDDYACDPPCSWANANHTLCTACVGQMVGLAPDIVDDLRTACDAGQGSREQSFGGSGPPAPPSGPCGHYPEDRTHGPESSIDDPLPEQES